MVYLNNKKFACQSCVKGHRSSSCHHTDRPLFEIKKKGRPVSQCEKCRELRQSKKLHSRCTCVHKPEVKEATQPLVASSTSKTRRFIPIVPALPNGLKDVLSQSTSQPADERQTVDALLNPCNCKSVLKCNCTAEKSPSQHRVIASGLSALATAAVAMQSIPSSSSRIESPSTNIVGKRPVRARTEPELPTLMESPYKHHRKDQMTRPHNLHLPPLAYTTSSSSSGSSTLSTPPSMPNFGTMPPIKQITSSTGSGCTCGVRCTCPGCAEHSSDRARNKCGDGCGNCIDRTLEFSLPTGPMVAGSSSSNSNKESFLDRFFACAAALPPPPDFRKLPFQLNPMDTTVFPNKIVPQVNLPKLCGGQCTCPDGQCSCDLLCGADGVEEGLPAVSYEREKAAVSGSQVSSYDVADE